MLLYGKDRQRSFDRWVNPMSLRELIMGTEEASELWGISQGHIKKLCRLGKCNAILIGKTWVLERNQVNPSKKVNKDGEWND
jgi:hypothetical protein